MACPAGQHPPCGGGVDLDSKVAHGRFQHGRARQQLDGSQVRRSPVGHLAAMTDVANARLRPPVPPRYSGQSGVDGRRAASCSSNHPVQSCLGIRRPADFRPARMPHPAPDMSAGLPHLGRAPSPSSLPHDATTSICHWVLAGWRVARLGELARQNLGRVAQRVDLSGLHGAFAFQPGDALLGRDHVAQQGLQVGEHGQRGRLGDPGNQPARVALPAGFAHGPGVPRVDVGAPARGRRPDQTGKVPMTARAGTMGQGVVANNGLGRSSQSAGPGAGLRRHRRRPGAFLDRARRSPRPISTPWRAGAGLAHRRQLQLSAGIATPRSALLSLSHCCHCGVS